MQVRERECEEQSRAERLGQMCLVLPCCCALPVFVQGHGLGWAGRAEQGVPGKGPYALPAVPPVPSSPMAQGSMATGVVTVATPRAGPRRTRFARQPLEGA